MKRRGFLGFIGGAAVAGPGMAKAAAAHGLEAMSLGNTLGMVGTGANTLYDVEGSSEAMADCPENLNPLDPRHWVQRQMADFLNKSAEDLLEQRLGTGVSVLDPDLAVNRSFSLAAKIRIQRDRNFERNRDEHKRFLLRDIRQAVKSWTEGGGKGQPDYW